MLITVMQKKVNFPCMLLSLFFFETFIVNNDEHFFLSWLLFLVVPGEIFLRTTYVLVNLDAKPFMLGVLCKMMQAEV